MHLVTSDSEEIQLQSLVEHARANGWTVGYEKDSGQWVGGARRGPVFLSFAAESIVAAIWGVLQKTNQFPVGDDAA